MCQYPMYFMSVNHQGKDAEEVEVARVVPGENLGLEMVVDRHSNRQTMTSKAILPYDIHLPIWICESSPYATEQHKQCLKSTLNVSESGQIVLEKIKGVLYDVNHTKSSNLNAHCSGSVMELPLHWSLASRYMSHNRHTYIFNLSSYNGGIFKHTPILQVFFGHPTEFPSLRARYLNFAHGRRHSLDISASKAII